MTDDLLTGAEVARLFGVTKRRVNAIAKARGVAGRTFGQQRVFSAAEVERLRPGPRGVRRDRQRADEIGEVAKMPA